MFHLYTQNGQALSNASAASGQPKRVDPYLFELTPANAAQYPGAIAIDHSTGEGGRSDGVQWLPIAAMPVDTRPNTGDVHVFPLLNTVDEGGSPIESGAGRNTIGWCEFTEFTVEFTSAFASGDYAIIAWTEDEEETVTGIDTMAERAFALDQASVAGGHNSYMVSNVAFVKTSLGSFTHKASAGRYVRRITVKSHDADGTSTFTFRLTGVNPKATEATFAPAFAFLMPKADGDVDYEDAIGNAVASYSRASAANVWDGGLDMLVAVESGKPKMHGLRKHRDGWSYLDVDGVPLHPVRTVDQLLTDAGIVGDGRQLSVFDNYECARRNHAYSVGDRVIPDGLRPYNDGAGGDAYDQGSYWLECLTAGTTHASNSINGAWTLTSVTLGSTTITDGTVTWKIGGKYARHGAPGIYLEMARTNECSSPRDFNTDWTNTFGVVVSEDIGIDGTLKNIRIEDNDAANQSRLSLVSTAPAADETWACSYWVRKEQAGTHFPNFRLDSNGASPVVERPNFNPETGAIGYDTGENDGNTYVEDWGLWWRLVLVITLPGDGTQVTMQINPGRAATIGGAGVSTGVGAVSVDWVQLEEGSYASSPIIGARVRDALSFTNWQKGVRNNDSTMRAMITSMARGQVAASNPILGVTTTGSHPLYIEGRDEGTQNKIFLYDGGLTNNQLLQDVSNGYFGHLLGIQHDKSNGSTRLNGQHQCVTISASQIPMDRDFSNNGIGAAPAGRISAIGLTGDHDGNGLGFIFTGDIRTATLHVGNRGNGAASVNGVISSTMIFNRAIPDRSGNDADNIAFGNYNAVG